MFRLASMLYSIIGTSFAGSFVIAALSTGYDTLGPIIIAAAAGALLGIGTYKGYGLAFMTDVLTGVIGGGGFGLKPYSDPAKLDVSHTLTAIDIEWFQPLAEFEARMGEFARMIRSRALRPGFTEVLLPGEQEAHRAARKSRDGVPLDDEVLVDLRALAEEIGIDRQIVATGPYEGIL